MYSSNQKKHLTKNPIKKKLINNFNEQLLRIINIYKPLSILDAGCGEGYALKYIAENYKCPTPQLYGIDSDSTAISVCKSLECEIEAEVGNVYNLSFKDNEFDLVLCSEVLEHLDKPQLALNELARVSAKYLLVSVPHEPYFRLGNLLFLNHIKQLGNAPGHINHYNKKKFRLILQNYIKDTNLAYAFPWILLHGEVINNKG